MPSGVRVTPESKAHKREYDRVYALRRRYGMDPAVYEAMLASQGRGCAICGGVNRIIRKGGVVSTHLNVDHDHEYGRVRGLLCHTCNSGLGFLPSVGALLNVSAYLRRGYRADLSNSECHSCGQSQCRLVADHDHLTGNARGMLCDRCNLGEGLIGADNIWSAIKYMLRNSTRDIDPLLPFMDAS